jgi:hypothetical protein
MIRLLTGLVVLTAGAATLVMGGARMRSERTLEHDAALARWEDDGGPPVDAPQGAGDLGTSGLRADGPRSGAGGMDG